MVSGRSQEQSRSKKSARLCGIGAGAVLFAALWLGVYSAAAFATPDYSSLRGADRYETAVKVSQAGYAPGVGAVVLATGEDFPDALSAAPLAAAYDGPVLLTHNATLDEVTTAEITRLTPSKIFLVGLEPAMVAQVKAAFPELAATEGAVVVLAGTDRYDTARLVAAEVKARLGSVTGVVVAPGDSYADALSAAPLAAANSPLTGHNLRCDNRHSQSRASPCSRAVRLCRRQPAACLASIPGCARGLAGAVACTPR